MRFPNLYVPGSGRWRALRHGQIRRRNTDDEDKDEEQPLISSREASPRRTSLRGSNNQEDKGDEQAFQTPRFRKFLPTWLRSNRNPVENDTVENNPFRPFIPDPWMTFVLDSPASLICSLCQITPLHFGGDEPTSIEQRNSSNPDSIPVITPCGHVAGATCMKAWLQVDPSCPFCRMPLIYEECRHRIHPKRLTNLDIHWIPPTIPLGGDIPRCCHSCLLVTLREDEEALYDEACDTLRDARARYNEHAGYDELHFLMKAEDDLEDFLNESYKISMEPWHLIKW